MNSFIENLENKENYTLTENEAVAHKTTKKAIYDLFAFGGAYRNRKYEDIVLLFKNAYEEDKELALKCLFYLRDVRGGQGERKFFRTCMHWLAIYDRDVALKFMKLIPEYGRWDDLIYSFLDSPIEKDMSAFLKETLIQDIKENNCSLLAKWMPSENASNNETKKAARKLRNLLNMSAKDYRKMLSGLRKKIKIVERLMSLNYWDSIEFDKLPSKAGFLYRNAFSRRTEIADKYKEFINNKNTKVVSNTLYPYEIVKECFKTDVQDTEKVKILEKYWENLPDYFNGKESKILCVVDTSASMEGTPMNVAFSLGMYCAERLKGDFHNCFITFSCNPKLVKFKGINLVDKVKRTRALNICANTDLVKTFDYLLQNALHSNVEDLPKSIVVISDMEIDAGADHGIWDYNERKWHTENEILTEMEQEREKWAKHGLEMPKLIYWNVDARHDIILDKDDNVTCVSGFSPVIFEQIIRGITGWEFCLNILESNRYAAITLA